MGRRIIHVDMDAFYASVEQRDDPSIRNKPVVVGGPSKRGVVSAASYEAREFGIRSAMSMVEAHRRCPDLVVVSGSIGRYAEVSAQVFAIFRRYTPLVEGLSIDEAFLDVTGCKALFGEASGIAKRIKEDIRTELRLNATAGVSTSKFISKVASAFDKPNGLLVIEPGKEAEFLAPLAIRRMWGVGPTAEAKLKGLGFQTIGDLAAAPPERLESLLGSWGRSVSLLARGIDTREVVCGHVAKSIGAEETFEHDLRDRQSIEARLLSQARRVARRMVRANVAAQVVTVKLKTSDFVSKTRQRALKEPFQDTDTIFRVATELLDKFPPSRLGIRLTGVSVSRLQTGPPLAGLFPDVRKQRHERLQQLSNSLEDRFGDGALTRASLLGDAREPQAELPEMVPRELRDEPSD